MGWIWEGWTVAFWLAVRMHSLWLLRGLRWGSGWDCEATWLLGCRRGRLLEAMMHVCWRRVRAESTIQVRCCLGRQVMTCSGSSSRSQCLCHHLEPVFGLMMQVVSPWFNDADCRTYNLKCECRTCKRHLGRVDRNISDLRTATALAKFQLRCWVPENPRALRGALNHCHGK